MLQADEIIQQKEWHQLNDAEKAIVAELADTEAEFNLIKKMLQVSAEELSEVPALNPAVYDGIKAALPVVRKMPVKRYWYAVAATIVAITVGAFFILNKETTLEYVQIPVKEIKDSPVVKEEIVTPKDSVPIIVKKEEPVPSPKKITPAPQRALPVANDPVQQDMYAVTDVSVGNDPELLDLIIEAE